MGAAQVTAHTRLQEDRQGAEPTYGPESIGVALTNACNLRCITCWSYSPLRRELPTLEWRRRRLERAMLQPLFADAATLKTERIIFSGGGDPLAHPDALDIFADAKAYGLKVTLISNLTLLRDPERFLSLGVDTLLANYSGGDAASYVAFHPGRTEEDFAKLQNRLEQIARAGTQVKLVFVVCAVNWEAMSGAIEFAGKIGASLQFKRVSVTDETASLALTPEQTQAVLDRWSALADRAAELGVLHNGDVFLSELRGVMTAVPTADQTGCHAGHFYSRISARGDVQFCCNAHPDLAIGSLHDTRFTDLWNSERYRQVRSAMRQGRWVPGCEQCGKADLNVKIWKRLQSLPTI